MPSPPHTPKPFNLNFLVSSVILASFELNFPLDSVSRILQ